MAYYLDLFSPETYEAFSKSKRDISGFRKRQENIAGRIIAGDKFICYMTKLSRWIGVLEVLSDSFIDDEPIFFEEDDPFVVRFRVDPTVWLPLEKTIPIHEDIVWKKLSFTKEYEKGNTTWTGMIRSSLKLISEEDGRFLEDLIVSQSSNGKLYKVDESEYRKYVTQRIRRLEKTVKVTVPEEKKIEEDVLDKQTIRDSYRVQALIAKIGEQMGFNVWIPKQDRNSVIHEWNPSQNVLLDALPLNYDEVTLRTIEQIDAIWLKKRSIVRAFEVEHTTSVYSGILRMADLLALQPNMDIKLHIVAPYERREKVFQEIQRPVFSLLDKGPLSELCTFISYDSLKELAQDKHLSHLSDTVLDEYAEEAE